MNPPEGAAPNVAAGRSDLNTTLTNIRELLTNIVGIVTVVTSALVTFGAGAVVGHQTASPEPGPAPTVPAPPVVTTPPTTPGPTPTTPEPTPTTSSPPSTPAVPNGTVLGSYSVNLGFGHSIPLGPTKPTQSQFSTTGLGDLGTAAPADHLVFVPINGDKMLSLSAGSTPNYEACATNTVFATQADSAPGTSFCLIENGRMAGVTIASAQPAYVVLNVTVWANTN
ncbi:hypothetical protein [Streptomyces sp. RKAG293]|uniref:hypothetical protein n=1 Tax=Streptomyces sp. RKAG293 TaxID=2893403 RepID=UPI0020336D1C|nr:hypothetical protein [Streptomyces sp. RKAG293]MCM2423661.1 hypothetical protein [Streptomyces sp. RKAG293]